MKDYDKDNIKVFIIDKICNVYVVNLEFMFVKVVNVLVVVEGFCKWIIVMDKYDVVVKVVVLKWVKFMEVEVVYEIVMVGLCEK